jgi:hypothetical protein
MMELIKIMNYDLVMLIFQLYFPIMMYWSVKCETEQIKIMITLKFPVFLHRFNTEKKDGLDVSKTSVTI